MEEQISHESDQTLATFDRPMVSVLCNTPTTNIREE
jgi:hypothetical protein